MCYLIAKKFDKPCCVFVEAQRGKYLAELVSSLEKELIRQKVQILTVSNMETYGEYKPYDIVSSVQRIFLSRKSEE